MKTLITAVMLSVIATAGFTETNDERFLRWIQTANKVIPKGTFISTVRTGFVMTHKGKVYLCSNTEFKVLCKENTEY